jgi:acetyl esterase/lipase
MPRSLPPDRRSANAGQKVVQPMSAGASDVRVLSGVRYGEAETLDVYSPAGSGTRPVVLFMYGNSLFDSAADELAAESVCASLNRFALKDLVCVSVRYRRGSKAVYPSGIIDVAVALDWVANNAESIGADLSNVFLMGYAVGGTHIAGYAYDQRAHLREATIRGAILLSANLGPNPSKTSDDADAYFGDAKMTAALIPINFVTGESPPTFVAFSETEEAPVVDHILELARRLINTTGKTPRIIQSRSAHRSLLEQIADPSEPSLFNEIRSFIQLHGGEANRA